MDSAPSKLSKAGPSAGLEYLVAYRGCIQADSRIPNGVLSSQLRDTLLVLTANFHADLVVHSINDLNCYPIKWDYFVARDYRVKRDILRLGGHGSHGRPMISPCRRYCVLVVHSSRLLKPIHVHLTYCRNVGNCPEMLRQRALDPCSLFLNYQNGDWFARTKSSLRGEHRRGHQGECWCS